MDNLYQFMRQMDAQERIKKRLEIQSQPVLEKPKIPTERKPRAKYNVSTDLPVVFDCPICGVFVRFPISRKNCKTCGKPKCVDEYRLSYKYPKKIKTPIRCPGKNCCNYLDHKTHQKKFCSKLCAGKSVTKSSDKLITCQAPTCCNFLNSIQKKYCSLSCAARERMRVRNSR